MEFLDHLMDLLFFFLLRKGDAGSHIFFHGHVGEKGKILEKITHAPLLRFEVDLFLRIEQGPAVEDDLSRIRPPDSGDAFKRHTFSAAGSSEDSQRAFVQIKAYVQAEIFPVLFDIHLKAHDFFPFLFRFSRSAK